MMMYGLYLDGLADQYLVSVYVSPVWILTVLLFVISYCELYFANKKSHPTYQLSYYDRYMKTTQEKRQISLMWLPGITCGMFAIWADVGGMSFVWVLPFLVLSISVLVYDS